MLGVKTFSSHILAPYLIAGTPFDGVDPQGILNAAGAFYWTTDTEQALVARSQGTTNIAAIYAEANLALTSSPGNAICQGVQAQAYATVSSGNTAVNVAGAATYAEHAGGTGTITNLDGLRVHSNLKVAGTVGANSGIFIEDQSGVGTNNYALWYDSSTMPFQLNADGRVGIGAAPNRAFLIYANTANSNATDQSLTSQMGVVNNYTAYNASPVAGILFGVQFRSNLQVSVAGGISVGKETAVDGDETMFLALHTHGGSVMTEKARITSGGNFLVGTTTNTHSSKVVAAGVIESTTGGFTFPDNTTQITAATATGSNTGDVTLAAVGSSPSANGASLSGQVLTLQPADATHPGLVTVGTQTFAGAKTFSSTLASSVTASSVSFRSVLGALTSFDGSDLNTISADSASHERIGLFFHSKF